MKQEQRVQSDFCKWLREEYPSLIFHSDLSAGMSLPIHIAANNKRFQSSDALPDIYILEPRGEHHGLVIEIKAEGVKLYKKDGKTFAKPHFEDQHRILMRFSQIGYVARFGIGLEECKQIVIEYMKMAPNY